MPRLVRQPRSDQRVGAIPRPPFDTIALLLQGGGSLGAYQGGVYEALAEADLHPDWVAGISIGAINAAIIAGNPAERRVDQLRAFWDTVTGSPLGSWADPWFGAGDQLSASATSPTACSISSPRSRPSWPARGVLHAAVSAALAAAGRGPQATSFYDTAKLQATLEKLVDFDRINSKEMHFSVGAVNVRTGNFVYFDTDQHKIGPKHIMASGALPPGFPAVEIAGEYYWDGGLRPTRAAMVVDSSRADMLAFQIDCGARRGNFPRDLTDVAVRQKGTSSPAALAA